MQRYWLILLMLLLAACQQTEQPPAPTLDTSLATVAAEAASAPTSTPAVRIIVTNQPEIIPGTLIPPATEDARAGTPFDRILFTRSGGLTGQSLTIEIMADGTYTRNDTSGQLPPDQVKALFDMLDRLDIFGIQGVFTAAGTGADIYQYSVTVDRDGDSRMIDAQDGLTPPELMALFTVLGQIGAP